MGSIFIMAPCHNDVNCGKIIYFGNAEFCQTICGKKLLALRVCGMQKLSFKQTVGKCIILTHTLLVRRLKIPLMKWPQDSVNPMYLRRSLDLSYSYTPKLYVLWFS